MNIMSTEAPKIEFPCAYPIKVMGEAHSELEQQVIDVLAHNNVGFDRRLMSTRNSRRGRWRSITVMIQATGEPQLKAIFEGLKSCSRVRMVL